MTQVCDYLSPQNLQQVAQHFVGIIRYTKNITQTEYEDALGLGLTVTLVHEGAAQPAALRGAAGGTADATDGNAVAQGLSPVYDGVIYYVAEDPNVLPQSDWSTVVSYFEAVDAIGGLPAGGYGSLALTTHLMSSGLIVKKWCVQTWGGTDSQTALEQLVGGNTFGLAVDVDDVLQSDYGQMPRLIPVSTGGTKMISDIFAFKAGQLDQMQTSLNTLWHKYSGDGGQTWKSEPIASPTGALFAFSIPTQEPMIDVRNGVLTVSVEDASTNLQHFKQAASGPVGGNWWNHVAVP